VVKAPTKRIEPMRGSAIRLVFHSAIWGALPLMAHPQRSAEKGYTICAQ
jgi:hypothetical protein